MLLSTSFLCYKVLLIEFNLINQYIPELVLQFTNLKALTKILSWQKPSLKNLSFKIMACQTKILSKGDTVT